ncbi:MAG: TIGR03905 family TSCPD domain-containing protein [Lachnospiraceae bacterium]|nr:TIGR03905 family TSCPD domain-containing protein [Lachnospiraceae bacterium]
MKYTHKNTGTCSTQIDFDITDGILSNVRYTGGCNGNLQGVAKLVEGQKAEEVMERLKGIRCGSKPTSCPDQLAQAIGEALRGN